MLRKVRHTKYLSLIHIFVYFVLYFLFRKNKARFVEYLERSAAEYSAY